MTWNYNFCRFKCFHWRKCWFSSCLIVATVRWSFQYKNAVYQCSNTHHTSKMMVVTWQSYLLGKTVFMLKHASGSRERWLNSLWPADTLSHHWVWSALVEAMAWHLFCTKQLHKPILTWFTPLRRNRSKIWTELQIISFKKIHLKMSVKCRVYFVYAPSQLETTLQCNVYSHWLGTLKKMILENGGHFVPAPMWNVSWQPSTQHVTHRLYLQYRCQHIIT